MTNLKGIENPKYVIDTCEKIYDELSKEFKRWVNKFQDIVLNLPEFQYRKEEIREYFSFISSVPKYYSDKIDRKAWTILDEIVPKKIEVADILAQPFTESGPRKPPNEEDDDENEGK
ncbi:MAG: hypothetical protein EZS28_037361 [Streblomastix strix]|uniref:Uncharacterized protein n=1 Tax=Streblomastix strix TaxID=222440 RepID=A0A5J4UB24_9EUKA|nr:MAG: hypothetical protein EZS28_037361 [Streblomastix strix]